MALEVIHVLLLSLPSLLLSFVFLCVTCPDLSSASLSPENGQSQDPGSSCPLPRVKPHAWAGISPLNLPHNAHSPEVQQVPVGLGKFKVVSLQALWIPGLGPRGGVELLSGGSWGTPRTHLCYSLPLLLSFLLPRMPAVPVKILYVFFRALLPCQPLAHKASRALLHLTGSFPSPPLHSHRAVSIPF